MTRCYRERSRMQEELVALEEDELVHADQPAVVRQRIERWSAGDAGGTAP